MPREKIKNREFPHNLSEGGFFVPTDYILMKSRFRREFMQLYASEMNAGAAVLDLNAGTEGLGPDFKALGCAYSAVEQNPLIREALSTQGIDSVHWNAPWIPADDQSLDLVISLAVFEHLPTWIDAMQLLLEVRRVLKPGGRFVVVAPNAPGVGLTYFDDYKQCWYVSRKRLCDMGSEARFDVVSSRYTIGWITLMGGPLGALARAATRFIVTMLNLPLVARLLGTVGFDGLATKVKKTIFELVAVEYRKPME